MRNDSVDPVDRAIEDRISEKLSDIVEHREVIEQAKGMLMLVHGIDADAAFELLRWQSQQTNVKVNVLAGQVIADFRALGNDSPLLPPKTVYDSLFMTARERTHRPAPPPTNDKPDPTELGQPGFR